MKTKLLSSTLVVALAVVSAAFAEVTAKNGIGDRNLVSIKGVTFAKAFSVDLMPTNAPVADASYSIRCQVIYEDDEIPSPTQDLLDRVCDTWELLNKWLGEMVSAKYAGMEYEDLLAYYYANDLSGEINDLFPDYVEEEIGEMAVEDRPRIKTVTVQVEAEGEFRAALIKYMESHADDEQN